MLFIILVIISCDLIVSGSYPYAEYYYIDISQDDLIKKITSFKETNPQYKIYTTNENREKVEVKDDTANYYQSFYFNLGNDSVILCVINIGSEVPKNSTKMGLVRFSTQKNFGSWKSINTKELSKKDNAEIKRIFENKILNNLDVSWRQ